MKRWTAKRLSLSLLWLADRLHAGDWHCRRMARAAIAWGRR